MQSGNSSNAEGVYKPKAQPGIIHIIYLWLLLLPVLTGNNSTTVPKKELIFFTLKYNNPEIFLFYIS
jgi:hypothetical protein